MKTPIPIKRRLIISQGGAGRQVVLTAAIRHLKNTYPKDEILVASSWPEIFDGNEDISRILNLNEASNFWYDFIRDFDGEIYAQDPYLTAPWMRDLPVHLRDIMTDQFGLKRGDAIPHIHINEAELTNLQLGLHTDKPVCVIHLNGGSGEEAKYAWPRDVKWQQIEANLDRLAQKYYIVQLGLPNQKWNHYPKAQWVDTMTLRQACVLTYVADYFVGIDSVFQHVRASSNRGGDVYWIASKPERLGWKNMKNIVPSKASQELIEKKMGVTSRTKGLLPFDLNGTGPFTSECPFPAGWQIF